MPPEINWINCDDMIPPFEEDVLVRAIDYTKNGNKRILEYTVAQISQFMFERGAPIHDCWNFEPPSRHLEWLPLDRIEEELE